MSFTDQEIGEFKIESLDLLDHAEKSLLAIETESDFSKTFDAIFRAFHNLKGAAGMMEMAALQHHVHELETILMQFKSGPTIPSQYVQLFLNGIDGARTILDGKEITFSYKPSEVTTTKRTEETVAVTGVFNPVQINPVRPASDLSPQVIAEFISECEEIIDRVAAILNLFEKDQFTKDKFESLYRDVHSLKGAAFLFSFDEMGNLAHVMESALEPFRDTALCPSKDVINLLFKNLSLLEGCIQNGGQLNTLKIDHAINHDGQKADILTNLISTPQAEVQMSKKENFESPTSPSENKSVQSEKKEADANSSIRVAVSLLDNLMTLMGEMVLVRNQVIQFSSQSEDLEFLTLSKRLNVVTSEIQGEMMKTRMQPIGNIFSKYSRVIHDLSSDLKKEISLNLFGSDTELDKSLLESIKDPLTHIVRNSCDHGIENPEVRQASGKPKAGSITIKAYHEGGQVVIEVIDDGKGLDKSVLTKKAIEKGIVTSNQAAAMSEKEVFNLIFAPGFSTAASVTNVSGRGVGMDVVRTNVERIGGSVELESVTGRGTNIKLKIPLTLAIVPALIVKSCGETFAIPQVKLEELVRVDNNSETNKIELLHGVPVYRLRGQILPLVNLNKVLGLIEKQNGPQPAINIAVLNADKCSFGLIVDEILDTADIVVKPINRLLKTLQVYSGATILGDGSIALILDVVGISKVTQIAGDKNLDKSSEFLNSAQSSLKGQGSQDFLVVRLNSPTKHAIALNNVHRLEEFPPSKIEYSKKMRVIRYGQTQLPIISINSLLGYHVDESKVRDSFSVVVIEKAGRLFGLEVNEIIDTITTEHEVDSNLAKQDGTFGNLSLTDELVVVVDAFGLISLAFPDHLISPVLRNNHQVLSSNKSGTHLKILVVEDTVFFRREISRILANAGHDVVVATDGQHALQILEQEPQKFELIVSDIEMPKMNGFDFAKAVRSHQLLKLLPMIAISSKADKKYSDKGIAAGFDIYIEKLKPDTLLGAIATLSSPRRVA